PWRSLRWCCWQPPTQSKDCRNASGVPSVIRLLVDAPAPRLIGRSSGGETLGGIRERWECLQTVEWGNSDTAVRGAGRGWIGVAAEEYRTRRGGRYRD